MQDMNDTDAVRDRDIVTTPAHVLGSWVVGLLFTLLALGVAAWLGRCAYDEGTTGLGALFAFLTLVELCVTLYVSGGFVTIAPYQRVVVSLFGRYVGVEGREGIGWMAPWYGQRVVSTALRNFETDTIKVNDHSGNPVMMRAVVVQRVVDAAKSVYVVENAEQYVEQQVVTGLRSLAAEHDYDDIAPRKALEGTDLADQAHVTPMTLRGDVEEIANKLKEFVQARMGDVGIEIVEARIVELSYAPEIAAAMLKRQQATAVVAARETIVEGAVGIVHEAMKQLKEKGFAMDEDRRSTLAGNLLVVLASDRDASPVIPLGMG
jgi:regulator of protease activity HflC (stomatin/prohibitin superfamily)